MDRTEGLLNITTGFALCAHRRQKRKYTNEPYIKHPMAVSSIVGEFVPEIHVIQAALLHDVVEDTDVTEADLRELFPQRVVDLVMEVTDVSKPSDGNRATRKALDREHTAKSSPFGASIKLADLIDNTRSIAEYDPDFAKVYLREKELVLSLLTHGNRGLWMLAFETLQQAKEKLGYV